VSNASVYWWDQLSSDALGAVEGLVSVKNFDRILHAPEQVILLEKAAQYGAQAVFFEASRNGKPSLAQAFVFIADGPESNQQFAQTHRKLWSWGGVPLLYRKLPGQLQLFRCAHKPDFYSTSGEPKCNPVRTLELAGLISADPWWRAEQIHNGSIWDDASACKLLLSSDKSAHRRLIKEVEKISEELNEKNILPKDLRRKLLILSLLIAYLEEREVFKDGYLNRFLPGAQKFFQVLANGSALVDLLAALETRFNGHIFTLSEVDRKHLHNCKQLGQFAKLIEAREEAGGQLNLWQLYSFKDLPVELISHIYQLFVKNADSSVYTPPFLVRLMLEESLSFERIDRLLERGEVILDPSCGSGVFLVEAYKRLVLHWRCRHDWKKPDVTVLKHLLQYVHGIDYEAGAIELAAFSLCLALCDALEPEAIRATIKLFPRLDGNTLHASCFFAAKEQNLITAPIGAVLGNPPFDSKLTTSGAEQSYKNYTKSIGKLPDKQLAYLFLHDAMTMLAEGGVLCMLQQYNFLYNQNSLTFRRDFIARWDVREILDFISVRGLFQKGKADTKIIVVIAEAQTAPPERQILHATVRRSSRSEAEIGFDLDYYDLHWLPRQLALSNDAVWRTDLFGGGRVLGLVDGLKKFRALGEYAKSRNWEFGEGFIAGNSGKRVPANYITGQHFIPSNALGENGIDVKAIRVVQQMVFASPRPSTRYAPPMLLVRKHMNLAHGLWVDTPLTYDSEVVGFCAPAGDVLNLERMRKWLSDESHALRGYVALTSPRLFIRKATVVQTNDVFSVPFPNGGSLELSINERILLDDVVDYYRDLIRLGEDSQAMTATGLAAIPAFNEVLTRQINAIYQQNPLGALTTQSWPGVICQPFVFGAGAIDWSDAESLKGKLETLLRERSGTTLQITRVARIYDGNFVFLLKPDRLRFWLRSVALRDADEILADLRAQGF
jgi:hypothetical protein